MGEFSELIRDLNRPSPLAVLDWEKRIREGRSLIPLSAWKINPREARRRKQIFGNLRLPDVPGTPLLRDAAGPWFRAICGVFLGAIDENSGKRLIRELFLLAPKKSSKTSYGAGLMLTALIANDRPRAEFLLIAPTQLIADLAFAQAQGMIENDEYLARRMHIQEHLKAITDRRTKATLKIKAFDMRVLTGVKPVGVLVDELHEISANSQASRIIGQIRGGILANPEGFLAFITTQSDIQPSGAFAAELQAARAIRDGNSRGAMMPILYEFPEAMVKDESDSPAWADPRNWHMVNPNIGRPITLERLVEDYEGAVDKGAEELRRWASQHLNIEIGVALHTNRWAGALHWTKSVDSTLGLGRAKGIGALDDLIERCECVVAGIDGGGLDDLLGLTVMGRLKGEDKFLSWSRAWAHKSVLDIRKAIAPKLRDFAEQGDLVLVNNLGEDIVELGDIIERIFQSGLMPDKHAIGVDPAGIGQIVNHLAQREGMDAPDLVIGITQGWALNGAIKGSERRLADGSLRHAPQKLMDWCVGNAKTEPRGNAIIITKQISGYGKIDPLMALFNCERLMDKNPQAAGSSFWSDFKPKDQGAGDGDKTVH